MADKYRKGKLTAINTVDALEQCTNNYPKIKLLLSSDHFASDHCISRTDVFNAAPLKTWLRSTMTAQIDRTFVACILHRYHGYF